MARCGSVSDPWPWPAPASSQAGVSTASGSRIARVRVSACMFDSSGQCAAATVRHRAYPFLRCVLLRTDPPTAVTDSPEHDARTPIPGDARRDSMLQEKNMNRLTTCFRPLVWSTVLPLAALVAGCSHDGGGLDFLDTPPNAAGAGTGVAGLGKGPAPVALGAAGPYVILAESAITNVPPSPITGDVGLSPATGAGIGLTCA